MVINKTFVIFFFFLTAKVVESQLIDPANAESNYSTRGERKSMYTQKKKPPTHERNCHDTISGSRTSRSSL